MVGGDKMGIMVVSGDVVVGDDGRVIENYGERGRMRVKIWCDQD